MLRDLLSYQETEMIAKRLKIAELIIEEKTYEEIKKIVKVSFGTIARVQEWLKIQGDGYRKAVINTKKVSKEKEFEIRETNLYGIKKRFSQYYWPEILLENIIRNANNRQKREIASVIGQLDKMKRKSELFRKIKKMIRY